MKTPALVTAKAGAEGSQNAGCNYSQSFPARLGKFVWHFGCSAELTPRVRDSNIKSRFAS
jgi:hypothetical protein